MIQALTPYFKYDFSFKYDTTQSFTRTPVLKLSVTVCTLPLHTTHVSTYTLATSLLNSVGSQLQSPLAFHIGQHCYTEVTTCSRNGILIKSKEKKKTVLFKITSCSLNTHLANTQKTDKFYSIP